MNRWTLRGFLGLLWVIRKGASLLCYLSVRQLRQQANAGVISGMSAGTSSVFFSRCPT
jgi:hypothetical protein